MRFVSTYEFKQHMTKSETKALLDMFGAVGEAPGTTAHYVWADGGGGTIVGQRDDLTDIYRNLLNYTEWMDFEIRPVLGVGSVGGLPWAASRSKSASIFGPIIERQMSKGFNGFIDSL